MKEAKKDLTAYNEEQLKMAMTDVRSYEFITNFDAKLALAKKLVESGSKLVPFKNAGDVLIVLQAATDFKMPISFALGNIHPIGGKACAGVHLISSLILKAGVFFALEKDYAPVYEYFGYGGFSVTQKDIDENPTLYVFVKKEIKPDAIKKITDNNKIPVIRGKEIDRITIIRFEREIKMPSGKWKTMIIRGSFSRREAFQAGLYEQNPHTWNKYEKDMIFSKAFTRGSKRVGDDILLGLTEVSELAHVHDIPYKIDENGNAVPIYKKSRLKQVTKDNNSVVEDAIIDVTDTTE